MHHNYYLIHQNITATKEQVEAFLKRLKEKIKVFDIVFRDDRGKNLQTLAALEINTTVRKQVIMNIEPEDYVEGPIVDTLNKVGEMWVFGKVRTDCYD